MSADASVTGVAVTALLRAMTAPDVDVLLRIEESVHAHPWTRGNFTDALEGDCLGWVYETDTALVGYAVLLSALDEGQLLNLSITATHQRQGFGRRLLDEVMARMRSQTMRRMLLEVRPSNTAALALYRSAGFSQIGVRKAYYAAGAGREDAIVMECLL